MKKYSPLALIWVIAFLLLAAPASAANYVLRVVTGADATQVAARYGLALVRSLSDDGRTVFLLTGPDPASTTLVTLVRSDPSVAAFEINTNVDGRETQPTAAPLVNTAALAPALLDNSSTTYFGATVRNSYANQPTTALIHLPNILRQNITGTGIVAIIDTGVDPRHPALQGALLPGYDFTRNLPGTADELADLTQSTVAILDQSTVAILDSNQYPEILNQSTVAILDQSTVAILDGSQLPAAFGHGTMVAGLVHLVAPTARIMPLKAFNADGSSDIANIVRAIYYAVDNGANIINMSFSSRTDSPNVAAAMQYAWSHNVICIASGGNDGREGRLVYPAGDYKVLGVGSTNAQDGRSSFSNYDTNSVRMAAPGEALVTTYPGNNYAGVWGSSFSTALTSGAAALMYQMTTQLKRGSITGALQHGRAILAPDMGNRLDLLNAVNYLVYSGQHDD